MKKYLPLFLCGLLLTACGNRMPEGVPQDFAIFHGANKVIDPYDEKTIKEFCMFMKQFMMETDEYQSLPDGEGGYI